MNLTVLTLLTDVVRLLFHPQISTHNRNVSIFLC